MAGVADSWPWTLAMPFRAPSKVLAVRGRNRFQLTSYLSRAKLSLRFFSKNLNGSRPWTPALRSLAPSKVLALRFGAPALRGGLEGRHRRRFTAWCAAGLRNWQSTQPETAPRLGFGCGHCPTPGAIIAGPDLVPCVNCRNGTWAQLMWADRHTWQLFLLWKEGHGTISRARS